MWKIRRNFVDFETILIFSIKGFRRFLFSHGFDLKIMTLIQHGNCNVDSTFNIDESSTWIFLCSFDVEYWLFSIYYFLDLSALGTYSKLIWYSAESMKFQRY